MTTPETPSPRLRPAVRGLLLDPQHRVLLVRWRFADRDVWGTPGGGLEPGEDHEQALRRELREETGLELPRGGCGPCVAHRTHVVPLQDGYGTAWDGVEEWFYLLRVEAFEPRGTMSDDELRAESLHELRWCDLPELHGLTDESGPRPVVTAPRELTRLVQRLLAHGHPDARLELGV